ncbi:MAG: glycosyltransferase family 4 protein [Actinomycetota bacterium]|nr:glycosyltransferase family 4 protein [Actinomycetota bacterium]
MTAVHQLVPVLHAGDAVGQHAMALQTMLRSRGADSEIFVELEDPETVGVTRPVRELGSGGQRAGEVLVYQFATASDLAGIVAARDEPLVVNYHNVTPPELFAPWDNELARHQVRARAELSLLAGRATLGVAVSEWNRRDLVEAGFGATVVLPPIVSRTTSVRLEAPAAAPGTVAREGADRGTVAREGARWLSVGRLAPNKALEDAIAGLLAYRMRWDPRAELLVVGKPAVPSYATALGSFVRELGLGDAVRFAGKVGDEELARAYDDADVLVVTSEHEGFCLPAVEAMARRVPVVAYAQGALPEVVDGGGVLLDVKDPISLSDAVHRLVSDQDRRAEVVEAGLARVGALDLETAGSRLVDLLLAVAEGGGALGETGVAGGEEPRGAVGSPDVGGRAAGDLAVDGVSG